MPVNQSDQPASIAERAGLCLGGAGLVVLFIVLARLSPELQTRPGLAPPAGRLTALVMGAGLLFTLWVYLVKRLGASRTAWLVLIAAGVGMRLAMFTALPIAEDDYHRYLWDGAVTATGENPYAHAPSKAHHTPPLDELAKSGEDTLRQINHPHLRTIYPPVTQAVFAVAHELAPWQPLGLRFVFLLFDCLIALSVVALLRHIGKPLVWVAIYWCNPLVVQQVFGSLHMDLVPTAFALAAIVAAIKRRPALCAVALALAIGTKAWPLLLAPLLLRPSWGRWRELAVASAVLVGGVTVLYLPMLLSGGGHSGTVQFAAYWYNNEALFRLHANMWQQLGSSVGLHEGAAKHMTRAVTVGLVVAFTLALSVRRIVRAEQLAVRCLAVLVFAFMISPTQFPWYYTWFAPLVALAPVWPLIAYSALLPLYYVQHAHASIVWLEHGPVIAGLVAMWWKHRNVRSAICDLRSENTGKIALRRSQIEHLNIAVIIPVLNEERAIGKVLDAIPPWVGETVVVDNGSTDRTAEVAAQHGARVVHEDERGYGAACLKGIGALHAPDIVVFCDGDYSDHPETMGDLVGPIARGEADLVIGSRVRGTAERGALSATQRFGNWLANALLGAVWRVRSTDLGPFRAIRYASLHKLGMDDRNYGWTVQMQARAARFGLRQLEVPTPYRNRIGKSKISGTLRGVWGAGTKILYTIGVEAAAHAREALSRKRLRVVLFTRYPVAGQTKTRMISALGERGAAELQTRLTRHALQRLRPLPLEVRYTGGGASQMRELFGDELNLQPQGEGDLGRKLDSAFDEAFASGCGKVIAVGADCPALTAALVQQAARGLSRRDLVVGPAHDGGYYLVGLKRPQPALFRGIAWGGERVLEQTLARAAELGLSVCVLPSLPDVDLPSDLWVADRYGLADIME